MKFLCLIYSNEAQWENMSRAEYDAVLGEFFAFTQEMRDQGKYIAGEDLHPTRAAITVRVRNRKISTTDGPFAETKEQLGGFYLIDTPDMGDAIEVASKIPSARYGCIEVRPVLNFSHDEGG